LNCWRHNISPAAIALLFTVILCLLIGSYHWALGLLVLAAYLVVGIAVPLAVSRTSGDEGLRFRTKSGELSAFLLDSVRGLPELLQYGQGEKRLAALNAQTDALAGEEELLTSIPTSANIVEKFLRRKEMMITILHSTKHVILLQTYCL